MTRKVPRRGVLQGMGALGIGIGGGMGSPQQLLEGLEAALADVDRSDHDPHTLATWRAVVDAVIPETPELGDELGEEHVPGGLDVGLEVGLIEFINAFVSPEAAVPRVTAVDGETAPLSESITVILDAAAAELLARGGNRDEPKRRFEDGGAVHHALTARSVPSDGRHRRARRKERWIRRRDRRCLPSHSLLQRLGRVRRLLETAQRANLRG
jgi:hypothetical protein